MPPSSVLRRLAAAAALTLAPGLALASGPTPHVPCPPGALGVSREAIVGAPAGGLHIGLETYDRTLDLAPKEVVLTFDDGPSPETTRRVLDALKDECVKATFFLIGRSAEADPALVEREIAEGHSIGYHTWSHPAVTLRGLSERGAIDQIAHGIAAVDAAAGRTTADATPAFSFFRFPGFADTEPTLAWLDARRLTVFGADLWASDWLIMTPEGEARLTLQRLAARGGHGIILFHDTKAETARMLPMLLRALKDEGYHVVHVVPGAAAQTRTRAAPPGWTSETEAILAKVMPRLLRRAAGRASSGPPAPEGMN